LGNTARALDPVLIRNRVSGFVQTNAAQANRVAGGNVDTAVANPLPKKKLQRLCHPGAGFPGPDHSNAIEISQLIALLPDHQRRPVDLYMGEHRLSRIGGTDGGAENSEGVGAAHGLGLGRKERKRQNSRSNRGRVVMANLDPKVRAGVGFAALVEQMLHANGIARQGTMGLLRNTALNQIERRIQPNRDAMVLDEINICFNGKSATAQRDDLRLAGSGDLNALLQRLGLQCAEVCFTLSIEDVGDGCACAFFDVFVQIDETPTQLFSERASDARLAASHKSHQVNGRRKLELEIHARAKAIIVACRNGCRCFRFK